MLYISNNILFLEFHSHIIIKLTDSPKNCICKIMNLEYTCMNLQKDICDVNYLIKINIYRYDIFNTNNIFFDVRSLIKEPITCLRFLLPTL